MTKEKNIETFVEDAWKNSNYMEVIHLLLVGRIGWDKYDHLDNATGNKLVEVIERYLVEKELFYDFGSAYGFSKEQLRGIGELVFSKTLTPLDMEIIQCLTH